MKLFLENSEFDYITNLLPISFFSSADRTRVNPLAFAKDAAKTKMALA
jgi:hypothetical protein